ncbi:hypothetical protein JYT11_00405 [Planctomycetaceae bacterium AH-315-I19]|nr:hypothetical protein [Planctomycetaceae bacterium AH-315-I19]
MKSVSDIQELLVKAGAESIALQFSESDISGLSFMLRVDGREVWFELPAKYEAVSNLLPSTWGWERRQDQAKRTAWRHVLLWVKAQVVMIRTNQVETVQVFLPYALTPGPDGPRPLFDVFREGMLCLPSAGEEKSDA